jgi:hypothetical protein
MYDISPTPVHEEGELRMKFTFMTKKGHKQQLKDLSIPIDSDLASNIHEAREALRDQHQEMKKLSLVTDVHYSACMDQWNMMKGLIERIRSSKLQK